MRHYHQEFIAMGRKPGSGKEWLPQTPFQEWLDAALRSRGWDLKRVSAETETDYSNLWRVARGNPKSYPERNRLSYETTMAIGRLFNDVEGALKASGYPTHGGGNASKIMREPYSPTQEITRAITDEEWALIESYRGNRPEQRELYQRLMANSVEVRGKEPHPDDVPLTE